LGSILLVRLCKLKLFNKLTHLTWCLLGILMILGWILSSILFPTSILLVESCGVITSFLNDKTFYNSAMGTIAKGNDQIKDTISLCLFDTDKDMLKNFNVQDQLGFFNTIFTQLDNAKQYFRPPSGTPTSVAIPANQDLVTKTGAYKIPDSQTSTDALTKLTSKTKATVNTCASGVQDTWIFHNTLCTSDMGTALLNSVDNHDNWNLGSATCIGLDQWVSHAGNRYTSSNFGSCSGTEVAINTFVTNFKTNRADIDGIFGAAKMQADLTTISSKNDIFVGKVYDLTDFIQPIQTQVQALYDTLQDPDKGLLHNVQCGFVGDGLRMISNAMCVGFISSIYQTAVCIIIVSMFAFFATFFVFCSAKRAVIQEDEEEK